MKYVLLLLGFASLAFAQLIYPYSTMYTISFSDPNCTIVIGANADIVHDPICDDNSGLYFGCHPYPGGYFGVYCASPWIDASSDPWPFNIFFTKWAKENVSGICNYEPWGTLAPIFYAALPNTCARRTSGDSFVLESDCGPDSPITIKFYDSNTNCTGNYRSKQTMYAVNKCALTTEPITDGLAYCKLPAPSAAPVASPMDAPVAEPSASTPISDTPAATPTSSPVADTPDAAPMIPSPVLSPNAAPRNAPVATPAKKTSNAVALTSSIGAGFLVLMCLSVLATQLYYTKS